MYNNYLLIRKIIPTSKFSNCKKISLQFLFEFRLAIADRALHLLNNLTAVIIDLETRLVSQNFSIDDENHTHRHFNDLLHHLQTYEKSITELLALSNQLNNDRLIQTSQQLASRWKYLTSEIHQRLIRLI